MYILCKQWLLEEKTSILYRLAHANTTGNQSNVDTCAYILYLSNSGFIT